MYRPCFTIVLSLALGLLSIPAFAKTPAETRAAEGEESVEERPSRSIIRFGVMAMGNSTNISFSDDEAPSFDRRTGFGGGLRADITLGGNFGIRPELLYVQRGMSARVVEVGDIPDDDDEGLERGRQVTNFHYLQVPLLARASFAVSDLLSIRAVLGPTLDLFLRRTVSRVDGTTVTTDATFVNRIHVGAAVGAGVDFAFDFGSLSVELRYDRALTSFLSLPAPDDDERAYHSAFSLMLGFDL